MLELKDIKGNLLPEKVQKRVNDFLEHLKEVNWFKPSKDLKKSEVDKQVKFVLKCFGLKAETEYRKLETKADLGLVWKLACESTYELAWKSAWNLAYESAYNLAWGLVGFSTRESARVSARAAVELLVIDNKDFKEKYPNWAFIQLFKLWEMWLYPAWVLENTKKFVIYADQKYCLKENWWFE